MSTGTKYHKNQPCDVTKIRELRGEVGKKTPIYFYDVTWLIFPPLQLLIIYSITNFVYQVLDGEM